LGIKHLYYRPAPEVNPLPRLSDVAFDILFLNRPEPLVIYIRLKIWVGIERLLDLFVVTGNLF
jgi:hypothetical protein